MNQHEARHAQVELSALSKQPDNNKKTRVNHVQSCTRAERSRLHGQCAARCINLHEDDMKYMTQYLEADASS